MRTSGSLFFGLFLVITSASAEIFKCVEPSGLVRYQNFPCWIDSIGSVATPGQPSIAGAAASATAAPTAISLNRPAAATIQAHTLRAVIPTGEEPNGEEPYYGMTMSEVQANWGDPKRTKEINGIEIWYYDGPGDSTRGVGFDRAGRVMGIGSEDWQPTPTAH